MQVAGGDRPFLLATVTRTIEASGARVVRRLHPILGTTRNGNGQLEGIDPARHATHRESLLDLALDRLLTDDEASALEHRLSGALSDLVAVTDDHDAMRTVVRQTAVDVRDTQPMDPDLDPADEVAAFLEWLVDDHLVLLGWRTYTVDWTDDVNGALHVEPGSGLGILRDETRSRFADATPLDTMPADVRRRILRAPLLRISRTSRTATVLRLRRMLDVAVTWRDAEGRPVRIARLLGLLAASGLSVPAAETPVLRTRLQRVLEREDVVPGSHEEMALVGLFQSLPKDELLELAVPRMQELLVALLEAEEQRRVRALIRTDDATRTVTVILVVPRDDYLPAMRMRVTELLEERVGSPVDADLSLAADSDVVVRFTAPVRGESPPDPGELEHAVMLAAQPWVHAVQVALADADPASTSRLVDLARHLPDHYRARVGPSRAITDLRRLDAFVAGTAERDGWVAHDEHGTAILLAQRDRPVVLSDVVPVLESLGLRVDTEHPNVVARPTGTVHLHEYRIAELDGLEDRAPHLIRALLGALAGQVEVDQVNRLVVHGGLSPEQVAIVRAYRRYRRQVGTSFSAEYTNAALAGHPDAVRAILEYFRLRFDPATVATDEQVAAARAAAVAACDAIERLDHDRIVRGILHLVDATLRTSAYLRTVDPTRGTTSDADGREVPVLAFKFDPSRVPGAPTPLPHREVFVSSPALEGVHLRAGPIARGGLRFSDRQDDLRTEVLGLMKAQVLKNAMIVPTGAKGGFVCKRLPAEPDAAREDVRRQYVAFIRALLDLTDNVAPDGTILPPIGVVRHDGDDPYLVVAADKGTATFSDTANAVAEERGFWLGDAFASGGSVGYDHKALGITARGAWTVIARHFLELGIDVQSDPVTVVGVGDMSGDVFGNGMLLSRAIRLIGAFDHRDVLIDPDPDPDETHRERERLFRLPGSTWQDWDRRLLSSGGMVVSRSAKAVTPTPQVRARLGLDDRPHTPDELIRALLRCQVDLLWFGGIGTYIRASDETALDVGDRVNDEVRVDATEVRARVVGEGANLAITPRARVQYARRGGRVDQDAIHNAAGVDISDHEVNVKILLAAAEEEGRLDRPARNALLADVTDDVVAHVLRDVDRQAALISRLSATSAARLDDLRLLLQSLEAHGVVDRTDDVLPTDDDLDERAAAGAGFTRPELATLMAGAKRVLSQVVLDSSLPDDQVVAAAAHAYLPPRLLAEFGDLLPRHQLHRELVATVVANDLVDRLGPVWPFHLADETSADLADVAAATLAAWHVLDASRWWTEMDVVDAMLPSERAHPLATELARLIMTLTRRYLDDPTLPHVRAVVVRDRPVADRMLAELPRAGAPERVRLHRARTARLVDDLVDPDLAMLLAGSAEMGLLVDVATASHALDSDPGAVTDRILQVGAAIGLDRLMALVERVGVGPGWERRERKGLAADVQRLHRVALFRALVTRGVSPADLLLASDLGLPAQHRTQVERLLSEVEGMHDPPLAAVSVVVRAFSDLLGQAR